MGSSPRFNSTPFEKFAMKLSVLSLCRITFLSSLFVQAFAFGDEDWPDIESCTKCCPLGRQRDDQGCFKCQCLKSGLFQGDIVISESEYDEMFTKYGVLNGDELTREELILME